MTGEASAKGPPPGQPEAGARIFIVEDESLIAMEIADRLKELGYGVCGQSARGEKALPQILEVRPDLVLMDIRLAGDWTGVETASRLRQTCDIPIVYLTAHSDEITIRKALGTEPFGYLLKPFQQRELDATIKMALHKHALEQRLRDTNRELERRTRELHASERFNRAILDALPARVAVLSEDGKVQAVNASWNAHAHATEVDWHRVLEGQDYLQACRSASGRCAPEAQRVATGISDIVAGSEREFSIEYPCPIHREPRWFLCRARRFSSDGVSFVVLIHQDVTDIHLAQQRLNASEQTLAMVSESLPVGIIQVGPDLEVVSANRQWVKFTGLQLGSHRPGALLDLVHRADRAIAAEVWRGVRESGAPGQMEVRFQAPNGTVTWGIGHVVALDDGAGHRTGYAATFTDITETKQIEAALKVLSIDLAGLSDDDLFPSAARHLRDILSCENAFVLELRPAATGHLAPLAWAGDALPPPSAGWPITEGPWADVLATRSFAVPDGASLRYPNVPAFAENGIAGFAAALMSDGRGGTLGMVGVLCQRSLTNPALAEKVLGLFATSLAEALLRRRSERRFSDLFELAPDAILITDENAHILYSNRQAEKMFGWSREELFGKAVEELMPLEARAGHPKFRAEYLKSRDQRRMGAGRPNLRATRRDGKSFPVEISLASMGESDDRSIIVVVRDISDRTSLQAQLFQAQKMEAIGNLTGGLAHDFNNYLAIVLGNLDLIRDRVANDETTGRLLDVALRGVERAAELTRSLLAFSRRQPLMPKRIDPGVLVADTARLLERTLGADIAVTVPSTPDLWPVLVDEAQLAAAIINLANNARDAMPSGGRLMISVENVKTDAQSAIFGPEVAPGDYVLIAVSDNGKGMTADVLASAFEPFFTTKKAGHGTGLGLSMVYGFVKQSGGGVGIYSEPGHGSTVRLYLPRAKAGAAAAGPEREFGHTVGGHEAILVVEDSAVLRETVTVQLTALGYRVISAENAAAALAFVGDLDMDIDLLFTDVVMPGGMNGLELATEARRLRPTLKVLLTSGFPGRALESDGTEPAPAPLLVKPYRRDLLAAAVRSALGGEVPAERGDA